MLHFNNKDQFNQFAANLEKWVDQAITEHQEETYKKAFGKEYNDPDRKQPPLPLDIAYKVALNRLQSANKLKTRYPLLKQTTKNR